MSIPTEILESVARLDAKREAYLELCGPGDARTVAAYDVDLYDALADHVPDGDRAEVLAWVAHAIAQMQAAEADAEAEFEALNEERDDR